MANWKGIERKRPSSTRDIETAFIIKMLIILAFDMKQIGDKAYYFRTGDRVM